MDYDYIQFTGHAIQRMFERNITDSDIVKVLESGKTIIGYPDDTPFPSYVILGFLNNEPIHVVAALDENAKTCYIITVYKPNPKVWDKSFKKKVVK